MYIFNILCREIFRKYSLIGSIFELIFFYENNYVVLTNEIFSFIGFNNWNILVLYEIKKVTRFYFDISSIDKRIDRQGNNSHKSEWSRPSNTPYLPNIIYIDKFDNFFRKICRCFHILWKSMRNCISMRVYYTGYTISKWIDVESIIHMYGLTASIGECLKDMLYFYRRRTIYICYCTSNS